MSRPYFLRRSLIQSPCFVSLCVMVGGILWHFLTYGWFTWMFGNSIPVYAVDLRFAAFLSGASVLVYRLVLNVREIP